VTYDCDSHFRVSVKRASSIPLVPEFGSATPTGFPTQLRTVSSVGIKNKNQKKKKKKKTITVSFSVDVNLSALQSVSPTVDRSPTYNPGVRRLNTQRYVRFKLSVLPDCACLRPLLPPNPSVIFPGVRFRVLHPNSFVSATTPNVTIRGRKAFIPPAPPVAPCPPQLVHGDCPGDGNRLLQIQYGFHKLSSKDGGSTFTLDVPAWPGRWGAPLTGLFHANSYR